MYRSAKTCAIARNGKTVVGAAFAVALMVGCGPAVAEEPVNTGYFGGVAIMGYDPVAYFTEGRAVKGSEEFSYEWLGTPWHFASSKHRDLFVSDPVKYAPQYGGFCVGEIAFQGATIDIDPEAWRIVNGKLYLSYDQTTAEHTAAFLPKAEVNWPAVKTKLEQDGFQ
jgi:YHS domain-containing protein